MMGESVELWFFFFFQAEDGIRDYKVTGVQTCALPISLRTFRRVRLERAAASRLRAFVCPSGQARMPAEPLRIRDGGQSQLFRIKKEPFGVAVEQTQLLPQLVLAVAWQGLSQIFDHGAHTAHDLEIVAAIGAYLTEREMDEVFPIRRPENDPQLAGAVEYLIGSETAAPDGTEHAMQLVDGKHRSRRVVYCWRQRLDRNIDDNAKRECRILLQCPLGAKRDCRAQHSFVNSLCLAVEIE